MGVPYSSFSRMIKRWVSRILPRILRAVKLSSAGRVSFQIKRWVSRILRILFQKPVLTSCQGFDEDLSRA